MRYHSHRYTGDGFPFEIHIVIILIFYLAFIVLMLWKQHKKNKRDNALLDKSIKDGYCFIEQSAEIPDVPYRFQILNSCMHYPSFSAIIMGKRNGINFGIMDYTYRTNQRRSRIVLNTLWIIYCKEYYNINSFTLYSRTDEDNRNPFIRVTFPEDKAFSKKFDLYGSDDRKLKKLFNQNLRDAFLRENNFSFDFECSRGYFLVTVRGASCPDFDYEARMKILERMINLYKTLLARYK